MKHINITVAGSLLSLCISTNSLIIPRQSSNPDAADIKTAVYAWRNDTQIVSEFLNQAGARSFTSHAAFHSAAVAAYDAELDELTHKQVLDNELPASSDLAQANTTLVADGTFQSVVNLLNDLTTLHYGQINKIRKDVKQINFGHNGIAGRCAAVLPAIDTYFSQAAKEVQSLDGDTSLDGLQAVRPTACGTSS